MAFRWLKSLSPRSLFGRTALILLVPILTIQLVVSYVFIQRLYENVTEQMTRSLIPVVRLVLEEVEAGADIEDAIARGERLATPLGMTLRAEAGDQLSGRRFWYDLSGRVVTRVLAGEVEGAGAVDLVTNDRRVRFAVDTSNGPVVVGFSRNRVSASNPHQLLVLMVFVSAVVTLVSFLFLKNQVRPIRRLAEAAAAFGKGQVVPYRPSGATEVRQAGAAFLEMRARIERHIEQRTLMLSGVSHDLRTPLTRLKLGLSMLPQDDDVQALTHDVAEMERMLDTFLGFARIDATETREPVDPVAMAATIVDRAAQGGWNISLDAPPLGEVMVDLRPMAVERALDNLIGNALRYGTVVRVGVTVLDNSVRFSVEDNGPGIPEDQRADAVKPFSRLDAARNLDKGGSVGLGLSIVRDIARQHGGTLRLGDSADLGGLQADLLLAR